MPRHQNARNDSRHALVVAERRSPLSPMQVSSFPNQILPQSLSTRFPVRLALVTEGHPTLNPKGG